MFIMIYQVLTSLFILFNSVKLSCRSDGSRTDFSHQLLLLVGDEAVFFPGLQHLIVPLEYVMIFVNDFKGILIVPWKCVIIIVNVVKGCHPI